MLLDNDTFLTFLHKLFNQSKSSGSLYITMKRYDGRVKPIPKRVQKVKDVHVTNENSCLLRATLGNQKISTVAGCSSSQNCSKRKWIVAKDGRLFSSAAQHSSIRSYNSGGQPGGFDMRYPASTCLRTSALCIPG
ncbi:unnamed protein product [Schistosoma margrebowiei]|uniref:Signal recognition particle 14 kDa protein n=2 Tax=Schistosoma margrebowiei TaxID=48269 RepID=A0AA84Z9K7_9TREM|nr:unnamed protein product [Schistosoma margrebowiei]